MDRKKNKNLKDYLNGYNDNLGKQIFDEWFAFKIGFNKSTFSQEDDIEVRNRIKRNVDNKIDEKHHQNKMRVHTSLIFILSGIAAMWLIAFFLPSNFFPQKISKNLESERSMIQRSASYGQKVILTLFDGTRVHLNAGSKIIYPIHFAKDQREVVLEGEAYFEVTKNPGRLFIVRTSSLTMTVLGTRFNVKAYTNESKTLVTLASGKVKVKMDNHDKNSDEVLLSPNEEVILDKTNRRYSIKDVNVADRIAWVSNTIIFNGETIDEVIAILEKWYGVSIQLQNRDVKSVRLVGKYSNQSFEEVLRSICFISGRDYEFKNQKEVIIK